MKKYISTMAIAIIMQFSPNANAEFTSPLVGPDKCGDMNIGGYVDVLDSLFAAQVAVYSLTGQYLPSISAFITGGGVATLEQATASCINGDTDYNSSINILDALFMAQVAVNIPRSPGCAWQDNCNNRPAETCLNMYGYSLAAFEGAYCQTQEPCSSQCHPINPADWASFWPGASFTLTPRGSGPGCSAGSHPRGLDPAQCFYGTVGNPDVLSMFDITPTTGRLPAGCQTYGGCLHSVINNTLHSLNPGDPMPVFSCWYNNTGQNPTDFLFCRQP